jgi:hypothetical protein
MKLALSAIALGASLACACHGAFAQTVTVTQQGVGNTSYAEQFVQTPADQNYPPGATTATITQVGNNNHVGGPGATSGGIFQRLYQWGGSDAVVSQTGTGNNAGITQDGTPGANSPPVDARITQQGHRNDATITQTSLLSTDTTVDQNGNGNLARLEQIGSGDASLHVTQNGTGNRTTVSHNDSSHGGPQVTQTGAGNTVSLVAENLLGPGARITQTGSVNNASVRLTDTDVLLTLSQQGVGNFANAIETGSGFANISQDGTNNFASLTQDRGFKADIAQIGNSNRATVGQYGPAYYEANVNQTGSGNWTSVYQH